MQLKLGAGCYGQDATDTSLGTEKAHSLTGIEAHEARDNFLVLFSSFLQHMHLKCRQCSINIVK